MKRPSFGKHARHQLRGYKGKISRQTSKFGIGGLPKESSEPKPITLRRADYDRQKGPSA